MTRPPLPRSLPAATVFAHRGDRVAERENTIAAFRSAAAAGGTGGVELDVRRTADLHLAVHHDAEIEGVGAIVDHDLATLRTAAPWLPTIPEAIDACDDLWVNVEIKNNPAEADWDPDRSAVSLFTGIILDPEGIIVSSFDWDTVAMTAALGWTSAYLVSSDLEAAIERAAGGGMRAINPRADLVTEAAVAAAHDAGMWVMAWTVNDIDQAKLLQNMGVEVIFTDDPARMVSGLA